ncbi:hypothetical protein BGX26_006403 [Mortierella sp. AD094]|nr:hypothetical protein BGX26_006403 [Mortierella sp. AD094]
MDMVMDMDKDKEEANDSGSRSRIDPLVIPEILANILGFLDPTSLHVCARVAHLWRSISLNIAWRAYFIDESYFFDCVEKKIDSSDHHDILEVTGGNQIVPGIKLSEFSKNCSKIRSLAISETVVSRLSYIRYGHWDWSLSDLGLRYLQEPGLKNLVHLKIQLPIAKLLKPHDVLPIHDEMRSLLSRNPRIRDLELGEMGATIAGSADPLLQLLKATENQLRRLSITSPFTHEISITKIFQFLMDSNKRRSQLTETCLESSTTERGGVELDELVLHNRFINENGAFASMQAQGLVSISGSLSIHSLTLLGFETGNIYTFEEYLAAEIEGDATLPPNNSVLVILRKCPLLERLCIRPDISLMDKPSPHDFHTRLIDAFPQRSADELWIPEIAGFVKEMHEACPKLKSIDFGMMYELSDHHWQEMTAFYGPQLESFKAYNVQEFPSRALLNLIGPPLNHIARISNRNLYCLSELDISGIGGLYDCAWLVFAHMPTLRRLAARGVPLDASELIGYDWVCKDIESLEIFVLVPKQWWLKTDHWVWDDTSGEWALLSQEDGWEYDDVDILEQGQQESPSRREQSDSESNCESEDGYEEKYGRKRRKTDDGRKGEKKNRSKSREKGGHKDKEENKDKKRRKEKNNRKEKKERKEKREHKERKRKEKKERKRKESIPAGMDSRKCSKRKKKSRDSSTSDSDPDPETTTRAPTAADLQAMRPKDYSKYVQVQVCKQLGQLRKLRSLTLEGEADYWYHDCEWGCLELTIDTGLDRLEPLQNSLERLVIYQLQEKLCGPKEMDWVARHWVHHHNSRWLQTHQPWVQLENRPESVSNNTSDLQDHVMSYPIFKELIGISIRGWDRSVIKTNLVLAWFQEECPTVTVEKDVLRDNDDFSFGRFQEY